MPETKILDTVTTISAFLGQIEIYNEFIDDIFSQLLTIGAFVTNSNGSQAGVVYKQGDLIMVLENYPYIDYVMNTMGQLVLTTQGSDAELYSINQETGNLEYTVNS